MKQFQTPKIHLMDSICKRKKKIKVSSFFFFFFFFLHKFFLFFFLLLLLFFPLWCPQEMRHTRRLQTLTKCALLIRATLAHCSGTPWPDGIYIGETPDPLQKVLLVSVPHDSSLCTTPCTESRPSVPSSHHCVQSTIQYHNCYGTTKYDWQYTAGEPLPFYFPPLLLSI